MVQDYSQRIEEGNIYRQKLSRLKLYRLRLHRHRPAWAKGHGLRLYNLSLYGSETGVGGGGGGGGVQRNYILISFDSLKIHLTPTPPFNHNKSLRVNSTFQQNVSKNVSELLNKFNNLITRKIFPATFLICQRSTQVLHAQRTKG